MNKLTIQKYAHDFRGMKMTEDELFEMLTNLSDELFAKTKSGMYGEMEKFKKATNPVIKFMNDNPKMFNPHSKIIITPNTAEADTLEIKFTNNEFLKD